MPRYAIVVHGGCGRWDRGDTRAALSGVRAALDAGRQILAGGGAALDAVCAAVVALEDDPLFNAGTGSTLTRDGEAEMDAAIAKALAETRASSMKHMGAVVKAAKTALEGKTVDGKVLSDRVRERLAKMG